MKMMRSLTFLFLSLHILLLGGCTKSSTLSNKVILDINGDRWTAEDFSKELVFRVRDADALMVKNPSYLKQVKDAIVNDFIVQSLSSQWIRKKGLIVKAELIQADIDRVKNSYPDEISFRKALSEQGLNFKDWREKLEKSLFQKTVVGEVSKSVTPPTPAQIQAYFTQNRERFARKEQVFVRHLQLPVERDAKLIEEELKKGSSINHIVETLNKTTEFPAIQADEIWVEKGAEASVFASAFKMPIGRRSPVIKSEFGFHIFELLKKRPARADSLKEATPQIQRELLEKSQQEAYSSWLDEQLRKSHVFKDTEFINELKIETKAY